MRPMQILLVTQLNDGAIILFYSSGFLTLLFVAYEICFIFLIALPSFAWSIANFPIAISNSRRCLPPNTHRIHQTDSQILFFFLLMWNVRLLWSLAFSNYCVSVSDQLRFAVILVPRSDPSVPSILLFRPSRL